MPGITRRSDFPPYTPVAEVNGMEQLFRRMFNDPLGGGGGMMWSPSVEVADTTDAMVLTAELPGMSEEDLSLTIENNVLTISGEKKTEREVGGSDERFLISERFYGSFQRAFTLPTTVDAEKVEAEFDRGILTITLPKTPQSKGRVISVKNGGKSGKK